MAQHASDYARNVRSSLWEWIEALSISGSPAMAYEGFPRKVSTTGPLIRWMLETLDEGWQGRSPGATGVGVRKVWLLVGDVFWPDGTDGDTYTAFSVDLAIDEILYALRDAVITVKDYRTTPATPSSLGAWFALRAEVPTQRTLPPSPPYLRRQIRARLIQRAEHTE